jgi:hypothetical protein
MSAPTSPDPEPLPPGDADMALQIMTDLGGVVPEGVPPKSYLRGVLEWAEGEGGLIAAEMVNDVAALMIAATFE